MMLHDATVLGREQLVVHYQVMLIILKSTSMSFLHKKITLTLSSVDDAKEQIRRIEQLGKTRHFENVQLRWLRRYRFELRPVGVPDADSQHHRLIT